MNLKTYSAIVKNERNEKDGQIKKMKILLDQKMQNLDKAS